MWQRFAEACGRNPSPRCVIKLAETDIALSGLSKRKAEYILDLATHFSEKKIKPASRGYMDNEAVFADLCAIRGIGRWTAEMFLIFNLNSPAVLQLDDESLLKATIGRASCRDRVGQYGSISGGAGMIK